MKLKPDSILWIVRGEEKAEEHRFSAFCRQLEQAGFPVAWAPRPEPAELAKTLTGHRLVFLSDADPIWTGELVAAIRGAHRGICVVGIMPGAPAEVGLDDVIDPGGSLKDLGPRLEARLWHVDYVAHLELQLKEQELRTAKTETTLKQREEFLSVCAHDLRSPLGLIQSSLSMVLSGDAAKPMLPTLTVELLARAKRQAVQATTLVTDLLDVMSFEQGLKPRYELLSLHALLAEFHKDYGFQAQQKGVTVYYENPIPDFRILADADRVRQLLQNLFTNALKFTASGRNIHLSVMPFLGRRKADPPYPMMIVSVRDEGVGIPKKELQRIFDRFTQVKDYSRKEGRGLGLTVAKQISTLHDGNIWVESEEGKGSTFFVLFPHVVSKQNARVAPATVKKILVAEPNQNKRAGFFDRLVDWGYEPLFAKDGIEVMTMLYYNEPDLVILTPGLQKMNESDVASQIKGDPATASVPVLMAFEAGIARKKSDDVMFDEPIDLPFPKETWDKVLKATLDKIHYQRRISDKKAA